MLKLNAVFNNVWRHSVFVKLHFVTLSYINLGNKVPFFPDHPKGDKHPRLFHVRFPRVINANHIVLNYKFLLFSWSMFYFYNYIFQLFLLNYSHAKSGGDSTKVPALETWESVCFWYGGSTVFSTVYNRELSERTIQKLAFDSRFYPKGSY